MGEMENDLTQCASLSYLTLHPSIRSEDRRNRHVQREKAEGNNSDVTTTDEL